MLFDEKTLRKLSRFALVASRVRAGVYKGERRSTKRGSSLEFADYRSYTPGDDLRRLDWNVYARLGRPFLKLFEEEEDLAVHVLVDGSGSMDWGDGDENKFGYALRLAGALGAIALGAGDRLSLAFLQANAAPLLHGPARGNAALLPMLAFLENRRPGGATDLNRSLRDYALAPRRPGHAFLISDLLAPGGFETGLGALQSRGYEVVLIHLLAPAEIDPPLAGDLRLVDVETGAAQDVSVDPGMRSLYRRRVTAWRQEIQAFCHRRDVHYLGAVTSTPWERLVLQEMRQAALVK